MNIYWQMKYSHVYIDGEFVDGVGSWTYSIRVSTNDNQGVDPTIEYVFFNNAYGDIAEPERGTITPNLPDNWKVLVKEFVAEEILEDIANLERLMETAQNNLTSLQKRLNLTCESNEK